MLPLQGLSVSNSGFRAAETDFRLIDCFDVRTDTCTLTPTCRLRHVLATALRAYFAALDDVTLADITSPMRPRGRSGAMTLRLQDPSSRKSGRTQQVTPATVGRHQPLPARALPDSVIGHCAPALNFSSKSASRARSAVSLK